METVRKTHEFALFIEDLSFLVSSSKNQALTFKDNVFCDRVRRVLRVQDGQHVILFDRKIQIKACFDESLNNTKKSITLLIIESRPILKFFPSIAVGIPLLKKDAFEQAVYSAQVFGSSHIVPLITNKIHKNWWSEGSKKRLSKILIAAAEQSKNFCFSEILSPIYLSDYLDELVLHKKLADHRIYFDASGQSLFKSMDILAQKKSSKLTLIWGPEGDCDEYEKKLLHQAGFQFVSLGRTVLRAKDAVLLGLGAIRSIDYS